MYSFNLVRASRKCAACGAAVTSRLAGHYYQDPLCDRCFEELAPELVEALLELRAQSSVERLEPGRRPICSDCGDSLLGQRFVGHVLGKPLCTLCFEKRDRGLAALLILEEAALNAAVPPRDAPAHLTVAIDYSRLQDRLDAKGRRKAPAPGMRRKPK